MNFNLSTLIFISGLLQFSVLIASALVPLRLQWATQLAGLPKLVRQLYWVYGGYVVLTIVGLASLCVFNSGELAHGGSLARSVCGFMMLFWGIRLGLQLVLDARPYLTAWWLVAGEVILTALFLSFTLVFGYAALWPR